MTAFPFVYDARRKWVFHTKSHGKLSGVPSDGLAFNGIEKRKPDGDGMPRNKKNVVLQLLREKKSSSPLALEVDKLEKQSSVWKPSATVSTGSTSMW